MTRVRVFVPLPVLLCSLLLLLKCLDEVSSFQIQQPKRQRTSWSHRASTSSDNIATSSRMNNAPTELSFAASTTAIETPPRTKQGNTTTIGPYLGGDSGAMQTKKESPAKTQYTELKEDDASTMNGLPPPETTQRDGLTLGWDWWNTPMSRDRDPPSVWKRLNEGSSNMKEPSKINNHKSPYAWDRPTSIMTAGTGYSGRRIGSDKSASRNTPKFYVSPYPWDNRT